MSRDPDEREKVTPDEQRAKAKRKRVGKSTRVGKTDWAVVDALSDEEIEKAIRNDPDAVPLDFDWSEAVLVIPPKKRRFRSASTRTCSIISRKRVQAISAASTRCCAPTCMRKKDGVPEKKRIPKNEVDASNLQNGYRYRNDRADSAVRA
jgi:hypothetical protein